MAQEYSSAAKNLVQDEERPFVRRTFMLLLLASSLTEFDKSHADLSALLKPERNQEVGRYALRTQIIRDPTRPLGNGAEILQFFMVDPNRDQVLISRTPAVIYEVDDGKEVPLFLLSTSEVDLLVHGEGYSTPLRDAA